MELRPAIGFKKHISTLSLMMTGLTSIIGSGWLLSTQKISAIAGPAGLLSWVVGMLVALLVSLFFVEIGSCHPSAGGIGSYSRITHGRFCGFLTSWTNWLSIVAVPPVEAQAIVQYISKASPAMQSLYDVPSHDLTSTGILAAIVLMMLFMLLNYWSVKVFIRFNNLFTAIKIIVPVVTIIALFALGLHPHNFGLSSLDEFAPYGFKAIFISVITSGVVMSFNGFQTPLTFSEEIENPKRMLPIAVIGSILIAFIIYFLLQVVFIGALSPEQLAAGWSAVNLRSPYVDLLLLANLHLVVLTIYVGSVVSPGACGAAFLASCSRILYSLAAGKHLPAFLSKINPQFHTPRNAVITNTIIGCMFLFLFKGWYQLVAVISVMHVVSYIPAPIITMANRKLFPEKLNNGQQFKLPFGNIFAPVLLFILSILLFYAVWPLTVELTALMVPGLIFYLYYEWVHFHHNDFYHLIKGALWFILYLVGISALTFFGDNPHFASPLMPLPICYALMALLSWGIYRYGVNSARLEAPESLASEISSPCGE